MDESDEQDIDFSEQRQIDLGKLVADEVTKAMKQQQKELMSGIGEMLNQISSNSNELQLNKISSVLAAKDFPTFKRKSNEEQFRANAKVMYSLQEAEQCLKSNKSAECTGKIAEGKFYFRFYIVYIQVQYFRIQWCIG